MSRWYKKASCMLLIIPLFFLLCVPTCSAADFFKSDAFVKVNDGHLEREGRRLRLWGMNVQSGVFNSYAEIDALLNRLDLLGLNAIRLWPTSDTFYRISQNSPPVLNSSQRGDGSALDRFDYFVAAASQKGINLHMPMLHYFGLGMLKTSQDPAILEIVRTTSSDDSMIRKLHGFAPYVSAGYRDRLKVHINRMLSRRNPYTGRRYADEPAVSAWELANEAVFVHCAIDPKCLKTLPSVVIGYLNSAWKNSQQNPGKTSLPESLDSILDPSFYFKYSQFVAEQFITVSNELRDFARKIGGEGSGVSVQPFIFNTDPGERTAVTHYAYSAGDVFSASAYSSPLTSEHGFRGSPWMPYVAGGKPVPFLEYVKVKDKPFIVYEGSFFRPYPFRSEWGVVMAAIALRQDWDGAFLYSYGPPSEIYENDSEGVRYGSRVLPDPVVGDRGERGHYTFSFLHGGDPVTIASWSIGARLFLSAINIKTQPEVVWDIPLDDVFKPGQGYPAGFLTPSNLVATPRVKSMGVRFVSGAASCSPCQSVVKLPPGVRVDWDIPGRRLTVQTPGGTAIAGDLVGELGSFSYGISARVLKPDFGVVAVLSDVARIGSRLNVIGNIENSGAKFDSSRVDFRSPAGAMAGVVDRGRLPLGYSGPDIRFSFADSKQSYQEIDFNLRKLSSKKTGQYYDYFFSSRTFEVSVPNEHK